MYVKFLITNTVLPASEKGKATPDANRDQVRASDLPHSFQFHFLHARPRSLDSRLTVRYDLTKRHRQFRRQHNSLERGLPLQETFWEQTPQLKTCTASPTLSADLVSIHLVCTEKGEPENPAPN